MYLGAVNIDEVGDDGRSSIGENVAHDDDREEFIGRGAPGVEHDERRDGELLGGGRRRRVCVLVWVRGTCVEEANACKPAGEKCVVRLAILY